VVVVLAVVEETKKKMLMRRRLRCCWVCGRCWREMRSRSQVKAGLLLLSIFGFSHKKEKIQIYIFGRNPKNNRSEKRMLEC
jgi:hypothetical protein